MKSEHALLVRTSHDCDLCLGIREKSRGVGGGQGHLRKKQPFLRLWFDSPRRLATDTGIRTQKEIWVSHGEGGKAIPL